MRNRITFSLLAILISAITISCGPTYPKQKVIEGIKELCKKEYGVDVEAKIVGKTLGVRIPLKGLFDIQTLQIAPKALSKIDGVMLSVSRVALSGDRSMEFYTVITTDKDVPGTEIVMTRNVADLRRYVYGDISRGEFAKRMVFDVRFNPEGIIDSWLGEFTLKETKLDGFICEQASRRISDEFRENKMLIGKFKVSSAQGELKGDVFRFTVNISREGLPMSELIHGTAWHNKVLEMALQKISHVIYVYQFEDFERVEVHNMFDNKSIEITKKKINYWRKKKVRIE